MSLNTKLEIARAGWFLLPLILPLLLIRLLPAPKRWGWRAVVASLSTSAAWILYTTIILYPLYCEASWARDENPNVRFDTDRLDAIRCFLAWVVPAGVVIVTAVSRRVVQSFWGSTSRPSVGSAASVVGDF